MKKFSVTEMPEGPYLYMPIESAIAIQRYLIMLRAKTDKLSKLTFPQRMMTKAERAINDAKGDELAATELLIQKLSDEICIHDFMNASFEVPVHELEVEESSSVELGAIGEDMSSVKAELELR